MDVLLGDIQNRLTSEVSALKYVDENWGQLDDYSPNPPVKWPCALIDCFSATYENMGNYTQQGLVTIQILIADIKLSNSSAAAPASQKIKSKSFYVLMNSIYKALHGWAGNDFYSRLIRVSEKRIKRDDGVRVHEMMFTVQVKDTSAKRATVSAAPNAFKPNIETEFL